MLGLGAVYLNKDTPQLTYYKNSGLPCIYCPPAGTNGSHVFFCWYKHSSNNKISNCFILDLFSFFNYLSRYKKHQANKAFVWFEKQIKLKKINIIIFTLLFNLCSPSSDEGVASLSNDTTTTSVIAEEDYPIVLTQCLNEKWDITLQHHLILKI